MTKYSIRLSKENGSKLFQTVVEAESEKEAFLKCVKKAEQKGVDVPDAVWHSIKIIK